ncbi:hypothetical protein L7F22_018782 [Adiantum nelumboides]|nr:hypothetical protein [Adiantum nelumboides]
MTKGKKKKAPKAQQIEQAFKIAMHSNQGAPPSVDVAPEPCQGLGSLKAHKSDKAKEVSGIASAEPPKTWLSKRKAKAKKKEEVGTAVPEQHNVKKLKKMKEGKGHTGKGQLEKGLEDKIVVKRDGVKKKGKKHVEKVLEDKGLTKKGLGLANSSSNGNDGSNGDAGDEDGGGDNSSCGDGNADVDNDEIDDEDGDNGSDKVDGEVQQQLHAYGILPPPQQERDSQKSHGETSERGLSTAREVENPYQELNQLLEGKPSSKKKGHAQHEGSPSKEREGSKSPDKSMDDVAPRRRRAKRSPTPTKRKRSPHSPHRHETKSKEKSSRKKKERKRSPSSPSSSPSSSSDKSSGYSSQEKQRRGHQRSYAAWKSSSKLKKFKEGGKNISFLIHDGTLGATDKVLAFIQQFDSTFGDEGFTESSKLSNNFVRGV